MESNISTKRPEWLTESRITQLRQDIKNCDNPYTDEELNELYDSTLDPKRLRAHHAIRTLKHFNLL